MRRLELAVVVAALLACVAALLACAPMVFAAEADKGAELAKQLEGCWKADGKDGKDGTLMRFESARCSWSVNGQLFIASARYEPGQVTLRISGHKVPLKVEMKEGILHAQWPQSVQTLQRFKGVAPELELKPMEFGKAEKLPPGKLKETQAELGERLKQDQAVRTDPAKRKDVAKTDADNTAYLKKTVQELGWIDVERFGAAAANAAFLIVQHSGDLPLMLAALPPIEKDVKAKRLDGQPYALLYDRLQLIDCHVSNGNDS